MVYVFNLAKIVHDTRPTVNFPETVLPRRGTAVRLCIVNKNMPGVLGELTTLIGKQGLNILQTVNTSRDDIAYNVVDLDGAPSDPSALADEIGSASTCIKVSVVHD